MPSLDLTAQKTAMLERYLTQVAQAKNRQLTTFYCEEVTPDIQATKADSTLQGTKSSKWEFEVPSEEGSDEEESAEEDQSFEEEEGEVDERSVYSRLEELRLARTDRIVRPGQFRTGP
jgi:hypothetical protein